MMGYEWLIGKKITNIRPMTDKEMEAEGWEGIRICDVIEIEGGGKIYPSNDPDPNGPGRMYGVQPDGTYFFI